MSFLIFLDFDGVLHSHYGQCSERFYFLPRFEAVLRDFPNAEIVISSSWLLRHDLATLRSFFSTDIQLRVIGVLQFTEEQALTWYGRRHRIVAAQRYLEANSFTNTPWVAIDDERSFWEPGGHLIHCRSGFQDVEEFLLRMVLSGELPAQAQTIGFMDSLIKLYFWKDLNRARRFFVKHYAGLPPERGATSDWFEKVCASDAEFLDLLELIGTPPRDEEQ